MIRKGRAFIRPSGFILLVVIGILAVLLTVCVGFLSYTRGEQLAVQAQRNKSDTWDVAHTAADWVIANICHDLMDASGNMDSTKPLKYTIDPSNTGHWWFTPYEMHLISAFPPKFPNGYLKDSWGWNYPPAMNAKCEAPWVYLPADFFPGGGVRGRFNVLVFDTNACMNINDWNEDCNPSQCQMAHMMMDACGTEYLEAMRNYRDIGGFGNPSTVVPYGPIRYHEAWRMVTHTARYPDWTYWDSWRTVDNSASYNWVTKNSMWMSMYSPMYDCMVSFIPSDGLWKTKGPIDPQPYKGSAAFDPIDPPDGSGWRRQTLNSTRYGNNNQGDGNQPWSLAGFVTQAYTDPDTGRSPINVNTCYNSGEILPLTYWGANMSACFTMEAVWNVESLRRIIKVGNFTSPAGGLGGVHNAQIEWSTLSAKDKMKVEQLKMKLAYQYQELLCRYFTGTYAHSGDYRKYRGSGGAPGALSSQKGADMATYAATYGGPNIGCQITDYSGPRFNMSLAAFRKKVHDEFLSIAVGADTSTTVDFDAADKPSVPEGKLDMRTACACYDNMVPGKPADLSSFPGFAAYGPGDPIWELYNMQLARQEDMDDPYCIDDSVVPPAGALPTDPYPKGKVAAAVKGNNVYGYWADNPQQNAICTFGHGPGPTYSGVQPTTFPDPAGEVDLLDHNGAPMTLAPKGADICGNSPVGSPVGPWTDNQVPNARAPHVPKRQLCFSPDSFSTELTTTSTNFILIVNAQLVDGQSVTANPNNPQLHNDQCWNQWGFVVEIAPDVAVESSGSNLGNYFKWYANEMPRKTKTDTGSTPITNSNWQDDSFQDDLCPSLISYNWGNGNASNYTTPLGRGFRQMNGTGWNPGGVSADIENTNATLILDWKKAVSGSEANTGCDIHQVPPAGVPRGANVIYSGANQTQKRVIFRSIWCTNQGIER